MDRKPVKKRTQRGPLLEFFKKKSKEPNSSCISQTLFYYRSSILPTKS